MIQETTYANILMIVVTSVIGLFGNSPSACDCGALETALRFVEHYFLKAEDHQQSLAILDYEEREATVLGKQGCPAVSLILLVHLPILLIPTTGFRR